MRPKKDPSIRQEVFIKTATELFMEKGYEAVSVREVLNAVSDKSASPSVFYYYFESKDALYHACIESVAERYVAGFRRQFAIKYDTVEEWMLSHIDYMKDYLIDYLAHEKNIMMTGSSEMNHMFILDMRAKVTREVASLWTESLSAINLFSFAQAQKLTQFLSGGISEMIYNYMLEEDKSRDKAEALVMDFIRFSASTMGFSDRQRKRMLSAMESHLEQADPL